MGKLTLHILDTTYGTPARGIDLRLFNADGDLIIRAVTNEDGQSNVDLLSDDTMKIGTYRLEVDIGAYFRTHNIHEPEPVFLNVIIVQFGISDADMHYNLPIHVSPYAYSVSRSI